MAELKWYASNYLDDERCGVVDGDNRIIVRLNEGKSREECEQIAAEHNRKLEGGDLQKQVGMAEARDIETLLKEFEAAVETVYTSGNSVRSIEQFNVKRAELRAAYEELTNPGFKAFIAMAERFLEHYPPSVFTGVSGDVGPFFVVGLRELLKEYDKMEARHG